MAGEHVTTQHKPVVFVVYMQKKKQTKAMGRMTTGVWWWMCKDDVAVEYKERVVWRKHRNGTKKHLWELQRSYVGEHRERAECQRVVTKDGGQAKLHRQTCIAS